MIADDLEYAAMTERLGILVAAGYDGGSCYIEISNDGGQSKACIGGADETRIEVAASDPEQPAVLVLDTGEIMVAVTYAGQVRCYTSDDWAWHWSGL